MKLSVERRKPIGPVDYIALALTTFGVGYIPGAPGTYGSAVGVGIYCLVAAFESHGAVHNAVHGVVPPLVLAFHWAVNAVALTLFCLAGVWASGRAISLLGNEDPPEAVVDEVMGQLITFCFVPFGVTWPLIAAGFILFRVFDIWKPFPVRALEILPGGLGVCADDVVAGVYAGVCLAVAYAVYLAI
jgi:phosphatidylglycerophosphatase A